LIWYLALRLGESPSHSALVLSCTPCHPLISSARTSLTNRCCRIIGRPWNFLDAISIAYIDPQPPDISCTSSRDGPNASVNFSNTYRSFSLRCSGGCSRTSSPEVRLNRRKGMDVRGRTRGSVWRGNMVRSGDGDVVGIGLGCRCFTRRWGRGVRDVVDTR